jgi:hypothetical protein
MENEDIIASVDDYNNEDLEEIIDEDQEFDENGMPIYENDEEEELQMRKVLSDKLLNKTFDDSFFTNDNIKKDTKHVIKTNKKKALSLTDLNCLMDIKIQEQKPKKFVSKRCSERKSTTNISNESLSTVTIELNKRCFNPRKVPYLLSEEYMRKMQNSKSNNLNIDEFPTLK